MSKPRHGLQLLESELASFVSLLSHEAAGILLRILDIQNRTGLGLPDGRTTHTQLGLSKRRWVLLREELLRVVTSECGYLIFKPMLERRAKVSEARSRAGATSAIATAASRLVRRPQKAPATQTDQPGKPADTQTRPTASTTSTVDPDVGSPVAPFAVIDDANRQIAESSNVVKLRGDQPAAAPAAPVAQAPSAQKGGKSKKPVQQILPGMGGTKAAEAGQPDDIASARKNAFDVGIKLLTRYNGMTEETARFRIGKLLKDWDDHFVYAAIADAARHRDTLANPIGWIGNRLKDFPDKATARSQRVSKIKGQPAAPKKAAPKATPNFMGISKEKAARLAERSKQLRKQPAGAKPSSAPKTAAADKAADAGTDKSDPKPANDTTPRKSDDQIFKVLAF